MDFNLKKIMIVVAHPDDEILGIGGTINRLINEFKSVIHVVILGEGVTSRGKNRDLSKDKNKLIKHKENINDAKLILGYQTLQLYNLPDNRFDSIDLIDIIKLVEKEKEKFKPDIVFTHHFGDLNIDHKKTYDAVMTAFRPLSHETCEYILTFETLSSTEWRPPLEGKNFKPNFYIEIKESNLKSKISSMECYEFEKRVFPHPRSPKSIKINALNNGKIVGVNFAEAFCLVRGIIKN